MNLEKLGEIYYLKKILFYLSKEQSIEYRVTNGLRSLHTYSSKLNSEQVATMPSYFQKNIVTTIRDPLVVYSVLLN